MCLKPGNLRVVEDGDFRFGSCAGPCIVPCIVLAWGIERSQRAYFTKYEGQRSEEHKQHR